MRLFLNGTIKIVHTTPWPHYPNRNVFSDRWNLLYDKSTSFKCDGRLLGPAAALTGIQTKAQRLTDINTDAQTDICTQTHRDRGKMLQRFSTKPTNWRQLRFPFSARVYTGSNSVPQKTAPRQMLNCLVHLSLMYTQCSCSNSTRHLSVR